MPLILGGIALSDMVLVLGCVVLLMMHKQVSAWMRPLVVGIMHPHTALWKRILTAPARYVLGPAAHFAVTYAERILAWHVHAILRPCVHFFHACATLVGELADLILDFPAEVHWALHYLRHIAIPSLIHAAVWPIRQLASDAKELALALQHDADAIAGAVSDALNGIGWVTSLDFFGALRNLAHAFAHLWRYVYGEVTSKLVALEADAINLGRSIDDFGAQLRDLIAGRLASIEDSLAGLLDTVELDLKPFIDALRAGVVPAAIITAITGALALVWDGLFCRNTNAVGRKLCGFDNALLDAFLLDVTGVLELAGLVELTRELQAVVGETAAAVKALAEV